MARTWLVCSLALVLLPATLAVQLSYAAIAGVVLDPSGGVVPGVTVTVTNLETGVTKHTVTNNEGRYLISDLIPGKYRLAAIMAGFKRLEREGIVLRIGDRVSLDLQLEIGAQVEKVTVVDEVPLLRVDDAETGLVIDRRRIDELPSGRNPLALIHLAPNVNGTAPQISWNSDLRINGGRTAQIEYVVNGIPVTTGFHHDVPGSVPSMDAVAEIKVMTNGFSAEYGRLPGGAVTVVTRSGTNNPHGRLYDYFSTDRLNATPWNTNRLGGRKPPFHSHNFGANLGGPVYLPGIYKGRDRTFFFVDYKTTRSA
ncbi:MAG: carboxypeptidase regulatory-like domain-containing protein, partial [Bryobacteraceae bacterium]